MPSWAGRPQWARRLRDEDPIAASEQASGVAEAELAASPFPRKRAYLLGFILYGNGFSAMMVMPFAPMMTAHFFPDLNAAELGYQARAAS